MSISENIWKKVKEYKIANGPSSFTKQLKVLVNRFEKKDLLRELDQYTGRPIVDRHPDGWYMMGLKLIFTEDIDEGNYEVF